MREKMDLTFPLLMDPGSATIRRYGILNESHGEIPHPAAVVVDGDGIVRFERVDEDYTKRPTVTELLDALKK